MSKAKIYKVGENYHVITPLYNSIEFKKPETEEEKAEERLRISLSRTRNCITEVMICNNFEHFVTVTFENENGNPPDRKGSLKKVTNALRAIKRIKSDLKYIIIPEISDEGRFHVHMFTTLPYEILIPVKVDENTKLSKDEIEKIKNGAKCYEVSAFSKRCGSTLVKKIDDNDDAIYKLSDYVSKTMHLSTMRGYEKGVRRIICSKNLERKQLLFNGEISDEKFADFERSATKTKETLSNKTLVLDKNFEGLIV